MLKKLLRAPLPEQIVALLEKLEQDPDASHLEKVEKLLDYHRTHLTRYEEWLIKREMRKVRNVIRREETLNNVMSIVINEPTEEQKRMAEREKLYMSMNGGAGTLAQHAALHQSQIAQIKAQQNAYQHAWVDPRALYMNGSSQ